MLNIPPTMKTHCDNNDRESPETQCLLRSVCSPSCRQATWPDDRQPWKSQRRSSSQFDSHTLIVKEVLYLIDTWLSFHFIVRATMTRGGCIDPSSTPTDTGCRYDSRQAANSPHSAESRPQLCLVSRQRFMLKLCQN